MLYLVPTPIGNLGDLTQRALEVLKSADVVAAEDTRRTRQLLTHFCIPRPECLVAYREHREESAGRLILDLVRQGKTVPLCTDGGFPGISDPGYRLVTAAIEAGLPVNAVQVAHFRTVAGIHSRSSRLPEDNIDHLGYSGRAYNATTNAEWSLLSSGAHVGPLPQTSADYYL